MKASGIIESLRADMKALHKIGAIDETALYEFDAICPPTAETPDKHSLAPAAASAARAGVREREASEESQVRG